MSSEGDSTESPTKTSAQEQVSLCNGEAQVTPKLVELDEQRTPVKEVSVNGAAGKHASFANRKRSANAISQRIPVQEVVRELTDPHHGKYPTGISPKQLLAHILTMPEQHRPAVRKNWLQVQISRACAQGALVRIGEKRGRYTHVDLLSQYERLGLRLNDVEGSCEPPLLASNGYSSEERPMRLTCLESIELDPIKHQSSNSPQGSKGLDYAAGPPDANHNNVRSLSLCDICRRPAAMNLAGISESFLVCSECSAKAHPSCLNYSEELTDNCRKGDWQCSECKTCMMCASAEEEPENNVLLFCDFCDRACHMLCNRVPLTLKPLGKWMCDWCAASARRNKSSPNKKPTCPAKLIQDSDRDIAHNYGQANAFPSCECSANSVMRDLSSDAIMTKSVEKLEGWSADRVSSFLTDLGFQAEAFVFKEQDIDGHALLLLTRDDIVGRMSFKLGPALRIHRYVFALQTAYSRAHRV